LACDTFAGKRNATSPAPMGACHSSNVSNSFVVSEDDATLAVQAPTTQPPPGPVLLGSHHSRTAGPLQELKRPQKHEAETLYSEDPVRLRSLDEEEDWKDEGDGAEPSPTMDLVGWLARLRKHDSNLDRTDEFNAVFGDVTCGVHAVARRWDLLYLLVPGLFCGKYPSSMYSTRNHLRGLGLDCRIAEVDTTKGVHENAKVIAELVEELSVLTGKLVLLVGHSKGGCDAVAALARHTLRLRYRVAGIVCLQSPLGGAPLANDFREKHLCGHALRTVKYVLGSETDALSHLTYEKRREELDAFPFPHSTFPILTFSSETRRTSSLLAPLATFMHRKYQGLANDGMVACSDAHLPVSAMVSFTAEWDHGACAFPGASSGIREELVNEAVITLLAQDLPVNSLVQETFLTPIYDFWQPQHREHTFHHGNPWRGERKRCVAFYAFRAQVEGTEPVYSYWNREHSVHTFHMGEPSDGELRQSIQFYAFSERVEGAQPVFLFWHEQNADYTIHIGEPVSGEMKKEVLFYAFLFPPELSMCEQFTHRVDRL